MSEKSLRNKLIRLAHSNSELREHLLPLITNGENSKVSSDDLIKASSMMNLIDEIRNALKSRNSSALKRIKPNTNNKMLDMELENLLYAIAYLIK